MKPRKLKNILKLHSAYLTSSGKDGLCADLRETDLQGINLEGVNLQNAYLKGAKLQGADLRVANLQNANLTYTKLLAAKLRGTNLKYATLLGANLQDADLQGADLEGAKLYQAKLRSAKLRGINLQDANLQDANLQNADLQRANLQNADLKRAKLRGSKLQVANLQAANLQDVDLRDADLRNTDLERAILTGSIITSSTAINNWNIKGVICEFIFTDGARKNRNPKDRDFEKGEFERLFASLPTIEYVFENGMNWFDPVLMNYVTNNINNECPQFNLELISFEKRGRYPKSIFSLASMDFAEKAHEKIEKEYQTSLEKANKEIEFLENLVKDLAKQPRIAVNGTVNGPIIIADNGANVTINTFEIDDVIKKLSETIKDTPAKNFKNKTKKDILDILKGALGSIAANNLPVLYKALEAILNLQPCFGPDVIKLVSEEFFLIKKYLKDVGYMK